jgi:uncharacterized phage protein gp47/JayE
MAISDILRIDADGYFYADYPTMLAYFQDEYRVVYGADVYIETDSMDGQNIAIYAKATYDTASVFGGVFNSFSPALAQGDALSRNVAINGIARNIPTYSTATVRIIGTAGTLITSGTCTDLGGNIWELDDTSITIPLAGYIDEPCTCLTPGAIQAATDVINRIGTPTRGWLSVSNLTAATAGSPVETDAQLRYRQALATMTSAMGVKGAMDSALADVDDIVDFKVYENDTDTATDIPPHSIGVVTIGGAMQDIVDAIGSTKSLGCGTAGDETGTYTDENLNDTTINYQTATLITIDVDVFIAPRGGWSASTEALIVDAIESYFDTLKIGDNVMMARMYPPALLYGTEQFGTFDLLSIMLGETGDLNMHDYVMQYDGAAVAGTINVVTG